MNWYHREEDRYVEYGSSFRAAQRFGITRQLTDTVYNMNRAHLSAETPTVFESLDDAEVRTAGTTYLMYRGRHRHEPVRDSALSRVAAALMPPRGDGAARAVLRRHLRLAADALPLGPRHARDPRPPLRLRLGVHGRARPVRLPAALAAGQRLVLAQARAGGAAPVAGAGRPAARAGRERRGRARRVPRRARGDRDGRPLAGAGHRRRSGSRTSSPSWACSGRAPGPRARDGGARGEAVEPRIAVCPSQRAAMVYALHDAERDAMRASVVALATGARRRRPRDVARARRARAPARGGPREPPSVASCASPRTGRRATRGAAAGA